MVVLAAFSVLFAARASHQDCVDLASQHKTDSGMVDALKSIDKVEDEGAQAKLRTYFDDCLDFFVRSNLFESVKYLIQNRFGDG